jgi:fatty acid desaturase
MQSIEPSATQSTPNLAQIDINGFAAELDVLKASAYASIDRSDYWHLRSIERGGRMATALGLLTAWIIPNPITAVLLALGNFTRYLIAHHVLHKGYDKVPGIPKRYLSTHFAKGWRRFVDWFDWFDPVAWCHEHNNLHHHQTGQRGDPDLLEDHLMFLQRLRAPNWIKYTFIGLASLTWKCTYYAPNTASVLHPVGDKRIRSENIVWITFLDIFKLSSPNVRALWLRSYLPYSLFHFVAVPALFLPLGTTAALYVLINMLLAEAITNAHTFFVIGPNHTADDLHRFAFSYRSKQEFYVTQVLISANYRTGTPFADYMSLWLNYQIEHHLFPDLPMLKYRAIQPHVKALCAKYGVPYRQESIFKRFRRMLHVCVGKAEQRSLEVFPSQSDLASDGIRPATVGY